MPSTERSRDITIRMDISLKETSTDFIKRYQEQITKFFKSLDMKDGYITMSAFRDEKDCFYIFESGFRLSGELSFEYTKHAYGIDYLDNLISYALSGSMGMFKLPEKRNVTPLLVINHFAKDGEVKSCSGLSEETDSYWTYDYLKKIRVLKNTNGNGISKIAMSFIPKVCIGKCFEIQYGD